MLAVLLLVGAAGMAASVFAGLRLYRTVPGGEASPEDAPDAPPTPRVRRLRILRTRLAPAMLVCGFVVLYLATMLGSQSAVALFSVDMSSPTLRDLALIAGGAYVGGALTAALIGFALPPVGSVMLNGAAPKRWGADLLRGGGWVLILLPMVMGLSLVVNFVLTQLTGDPPDAVGHKTLDRLLTSSPDDWAWWGMVAAVVIGAPLVEEIMYRGCLQSAFRAIAGPWISILITSTIFAAMHLGSADIRMLPALAVLSIGLGLLYERKGRLLPCVIVHALFNAANVVFVGLIATS